MNEYFADTLAATGLNESTNEVMAKQWYQGEDGDLKLKEEADPIKKIVECTEDNKKKFKHLKAGAGDIILQYVDENGIRTRSVDKDTSEPLTDKKGNPIPYSRCRYKNPQYPKRKYMQMKGARVELWVTDPIRKAVDRIKRHEDNAEKVDLLVCVEGEKKAERLASFGIYAVGVPGINNYRWKSKLHPTLKNIIETLKPKALLDLKDSDYFFKSGNTEHEKDLATRCKTFKASVLSIHQACKEYEWMEVYTGHVHERFIDTYKGVDDLLNGEGIDTEKVIKELLHYYEGNSMSNESGSTEYIKCYPLSGINSDKIAHFLNADDSTTAQQYYDSHGRKDHLKNDVFTFRKKQWQADENGVVKEFKTEEKEEREKERVDKVEEFLEKSGYKFRYNTVTEVLEWKIKDKSKYETFTDRDESKLVVRLKRIGIKDPRTDLKDLLEASGEFVTDYDPFKDYFDNIQYNGDGHINKLADCLKLTDPSQEFEGKKLDQVKRELFTKWMMAAYRCAYQGEADGDSNDVMLVLSGRQGIFKSSFLNYIFTNNVLGEKYYICQHIKPDTSDDETCSFLVDKWGINVDDQLEIIVGKEYNSMKNLISIKTTTIRRKYARRAVTHVRRASFCGSVNEKDFLRDSHNRRFLCFDIDSIDPGYKDINMNDVWAEVKHKADKLGRYIYDNEDRRIIEILSQDFKKSNEVEDTLNSMFTAVRDKEQTTFAMTYAELANILKTELGTNQINGKELQTALRAAGIRKTSVRDTRFGQDAKGQPDSRKCYLVQLSYAYRGRGEDFSDPLSKYKH